MDDCWLGWYGDVGANYRIQNGEVQGHLDEWKRSRLYYREEGSRRTQDNLINWVQEKRKIPMTDEINWPDHADLGHCQETNNDWRLRGGSLEYKTEWDSYAWHKYNYDWREEARTGKPGCDFWAKWMRQRAKELGFCRPAVPRGELIAEMRTKIAAISQCSTVDEIRSLVI